MADKAHYLLQHPREQKFYHVYGFLTSMLGLGSRTWWGYKPPNIIMKVLSWLVKPTVTLCLISEILYMVIYKDRLNFETLGIILAVFPVTCIITVHVYSANMQIYETLMRDFMDKIHIHNFKEEYDNLYIENRIKVERYSRYTSYFLIVCIMVDWVSWTLIPLAYNIYYIDSIKNQTKSLQVFIYFLMPFDYEYNIQNWAILHSIDSFLACIGCAIVAVFNSVNYLFVFHLIGHIKMLKSKIQFNLKNVKDNEEISKKLLEIIKYHTFIRNLFTKIKSAFGYNVTANYLHNLIGDSILLFEVMFGEKGYLVTHGLMFLMYMGGLILMSFALEEIKIQSDDLGNIVYSTPWEDMNVRDRKTFRFFLARVQQPFEFIGAGGLRAGVNPMVSIMKSTFSYYVMLKSTMKK